MLGDFAWDVLIRTNSELLHGGDTFGEVMLTPGGSAANVAVWARRNGTDTSFIGKIGRDRFGQLAEEDLAREKVAPGMRFSVFNYTQGKQIMKGMVEVVQAAEGISRCRVLEAVDRVKQGDKINSIKIEGDASGVLAAQGERIAEWNKTLDANARA